MSRFGDGLPKQQTNAASALAQYRKATRPASLAVWGRWANPALFGKTDLATAPFARRGNTQRPRGLLVQPVSESIYRSDFNSSAWRNPDRLKTWANIRAEMERNVDDGPLRVRAAHDVKAPRRQRTANGKPIASLMPRSVEKRVNPHALALAEKGAGMARRPAPRTYYHLVGLFQDPVKTNKTHEWQQLSQNKAGGVSFRGF